MEQKEAELEKEIDAAAEEAPTAHLAAPGPEAVTEETEADEAGEAVEPDESEEELALSPVASGVGRRLKRRTAPGSRTAPVKVSRKTAELAPDDTTGEALAETDEAGEDYTPLAAWRRSRQEETRRLGRGGLAAIALLAIFVPLFVYLFILLYTTNDRVDVMRKSLADFNGNAVAASSNATSLSPEAALIQLLNRPSVKILPLKVENLSPTGRMVFYTDGNTLALTYGGLDNLNPNQMYAVWISNKPAGSADAAYVRLANIPDDRSPGKVVIINRANLPGGFNAANYAEILVTVEPLDQTNDKPTGARAFSLDLGKLKS